MISCLTSQALTDATSKAKCFADHLKSLSSSEPDFPDLPNSGDDCDDIVKSFQRKAYRDIKIRLSKIDYGTKDTNECVKNKLQAISWAEHSMKREVYRVAFTLSDEIIDQKNKQIEETKEKSVKAAMLSCKYRELFETLFDKFPFEKTKNPSTKQITGDNCLRRYVIDKKLLDLTVYESAKLNLQDIDGQFCDRLIDGFLKEFKVIQLETLFDGENEHKVKLECTGKQELQNNFFDFWMKLLVLRNLDITAAQKTSERTQFLEYFMPRLESTYGCQLFHPALKP